MAPCAASLYTVPDGLGKPVSALYVSAYIYYSIHTKKGQGEFWKIGGIVVAIFCILVYNMFCKRLHCEHRDADLIYEYI